MSDVFRAGHLPGVPAESIVWRDLGLTDPAWRGVHVPVLEVEQVHAITQRVREQAQVHLRSMSVSEIIHRIEIGRAHV